MFLFYTKTFLSGLINFESNQVLCTDYKIDEEYEIDGSRCQIIIQQNYSFTPWFDPVVENNLL